MRIPLSRLSLLIAGVLASPGLYAQTQWTGAANNDFSDALNWTDGAPGPGAPRVQINVSTGATPTIDLPATPGAFVLINEGLGIGEGAGTQGQLTINVGTQVGGTSHGLAILDPASSTGMGPLRIGVDGGVGRVDLSFVGAAAPGSGGSLAILNSATTIGSGVGGIGHLNVTGSGSDSRMDGNSAFAQGYQNGALLVGLAGGLGTITLNGGAYGTRGGATDHGFVLGQGLGSVGVVNVLACGKFFVSPTDTTAPSNLIGADGGFGMVTVSGHDADGRQSRAVTGGQTFIGSGAGGEGRLNVLAGGKSVHVAGLTPDANALAPASLVLGEDGGHGAAVVSGAGSSMYITGNRPFGQPPPEAPPAIGSLSEIGTMVVGSSGHGELVIADGGRVEIGRAYTHMSVVGGQMETGMVFTGGLGPLTVARDAGSVGTVIIGAPAGEAPVAPGSLNAAAIHFGAGQGSLIFNHTDNAHYVFDVPLVGNGTLATHAGTTWLATRNPDTTGMPAGLELPTDNAAFTGRVELHGGVLGLGYTGALGSADVRTLGQAGLAFADGVTNANAVRVETGAVLSLLADAGVTGTQTGALSGPGALTKGGAGTVVLEAVTDHEGATRVEAGTLNLVGPSSLGRSSGVDVAAGARLGIEAVDGASSSVRTLSGAGDVDLGTRTLVLTAAHDTFSGAIHGTGGLILQAGEERLTGVSSFSGPTRVEGGTLYVDGSIAASPTTVADGATLSGAGTVGALSVARGGTVAAGNGVGGLGVQGDYHAAAGSILSVQYDGTRSDHLNISGRAVVEPGAVLQAVHAGTANIPTGQRFNVLTASGGVDGTYTLTGQTRPTPYLTLYDTYDAQNVYLEARQTASLVPSPPAALARGYTPNQQALSAAAEALPANSALKLALLWSPTEADAQTGFDRISGEIHASVQTALLKDSHAVNEVGQDRLRQSLCSPGGGQARTVRPEGAAPQRERSAAGDCAQSGPVLWGRVLGSWGRLRGEGQSSRLDTSTHGLFGGVDTELADGWRVGALVGYTRSRVTDDARSSTVHGDNYHLGLYGGRQWGATGLRLGLHHTWSSLETGRRVVLTNFQDALSARHDANTLLASAELAHRLGDERLSFEPHVGLGVAQVSRHGLSESGGEAALSAQGARLTSTFSTVGVRMARAVGERTSLQAMVGWRHAFGSGQPTSTQHFRGGPDFTVQGVPIARDVALLSLGASGRLRKDLELDVGYFGQFGRGLTDQGVRASIKWSF